MNAPLTICILTNRGDARFERALKSAQIASEVLIADDQSKNDWEKLSKKYRFRAVRLPGRLESFSQARNWALQQAKHEWVLFLDSDEELLADESALTSLLEKPNVQGYTLTRSDIFLSHELKYGEAGKQRLVRLVRKDSTAFEGKVHEVADVKGKVENSHLRILHYSHVSLHEFLRDVTAYAQLAAGEKQTSWWQNLFEIVVFPPGKFVANYLLKLGFLDGWPGLSYATLMSLHSLQVRIFRYEAHS